MRDLLTLPNRLLAPLERLDAHLPTLARLVFAAVLAGYFWASGLTKLGPLPWEPSVGAYAQILPRIMESVGYDTSALSVWHHLVVIAGTWAEFILPAAIVLGLYTRAAALGMIGFVLVQTATDMVAHGALSQPETLGALFDRAADSPILDQRALWLLGLVVLAVKGGGPVSLDRLLTRPPAR